MPKGPNNRPTLKQALREIWDASNTAFVGTMRGLSGNIVCGAVLVLSLFLFSSLGWRSWFWWGLGMLISLAALLAYERWRRGG